MTAKNRKILNQQEKIENRDKLIKYQTERVARLEATLKQISDIASSNEDTDMKKINELIRRFG